MAHIKKDKKRARRRDLRVRAGLGNNIAMPRISVFRSLNHIYVQLHDDAAHKTVASFSSQSLKGVSGDKKAVAKAVGIELGKRAVAQGVTKAKFDRGRFLYHGRVQALADGIREGGLTI